MSHLISMGGHRARGNCGRKAPGNSKSHSHSRSRGERRASWERAWCTSESGRGRRRVKKSEKHFFKYMKKVAA